MLCYFVLYCIVLYSMFDTTDEIKYPLKLIEKYLSQYYKWLYFILYSFSPPPSLSLCHSIALAIVEFEFVPNELNVVHYMYYVHAYVSIWIVSFGPLDIYRLDFRYFLYIVPIFSFLFCSFSHRVITYWC